MAKYKIMLAPKSTGKLEKTVFVTDECAQIIWAAYTKKFSNNSQTIDRRNERGGIAWLSEIVGWKQEGYLPPDFDLSQYIV